MFGFQFIVEHHGNPLLTLGMRGKVQARVVYIVTHETL